MTNDSSIFFRRVGSRVEMRTGVMVGIVLGVTMVTFLSMMGAGAIFKAAMGPGNAPAYLGVFMGFGILAAFILAIRYQMKLEMQAMGVKSVPMSTGYAVMAIVVIMFGSIVMPIVQLQYDSFKWNHAVGLVTGGVMLAIFGSKLATRKTSETQSLE